MAEQADIEALVALMMEAHPRDSYKRMDESTAGTGAMLLYLAKQDKPVTAGQIASGIQVSTARVAVLLKKLEARGLLVRETGAEDARTKVVRLTEQGYALFEKKRQTLYALIGRLIDTVGMDRMKEFVTISKEIHAVMEEEAHKHCFDDEL